MYKTVKKNLTKQAFSLIEVIIAAGILSVTVFGVYKLIGENTKLISNAGNYIQLNSLFPVLEECITSIQSNAVYDFKSEVIGYSSSFNFGSDLHGCYIGNTHPVDIDNITYSLAGEITQQNTDSIKWELSIEGDGIQTVTRTFIQR